MFPIPTPVKESTSLHKRPSSTHYYSFVPDRIHPCPNTMQMPSDGLIKPSPSSRLPPARPFASCRHGLAVLGAASSVGATSPSPAWDPDWPRAWAARAREPCRSPSSSTIPGRARGPGRPAPRPRAPNRRAPRLRPALPGPAPGAGDPPPWACSCGGNCSSGPSEAPT